MQDHSIEKQMTHKVNGAPLYYFIIGFIEQAKAVLMSAESSMFVLNYSYYCEYYVFKNLF